MKKFLLLGLLLMCVEAQSKTVQLKTKCLTGDSMNAHTCESLANQDGGAFSMNNSWVSGNKCCWYKK